MTATTRLLARLRTERGASAVEYALIVTLVGGLVLIVTLLGQRVVANFASVADCYDNTCPTGSSSSAPAVAGTPAPAATTSAPAPAPTPSSTRTRGHGDGGND